MNRSAAMALFLPLLLVLLVATGAQAADEPSKFRHAVLETAPPYEPLGEPPATTDGNGANIGECFPKSDNGNDLSCVKLCTSKGYAGGHCDLLPDGVHGDCFCFN